MEPELLCSNAENHCRKVENQGMAATNDELGQAVTQNAKVLNRWIVFCLLCFKVSIDFLILKMSKRCLSKQETQELLFVDDGGSNLVLKTACMTVMSDSLQHLVLVCSVYHTKYQY